MVHIQHTPVTGATMMATLWFEYIAHQAVSAALILRIPQVETLNSLDLLNIYPKNWNLTRVRGHSLEKRPSQKYEEQMKKSKHCHYRVVVYVSNSKYTIFTYAPWSPYYEYESVVNKAYDAYHKQYKKVSNDLCRPYRKSPRHFIIKI